MLQTFSKTRIDLEGACVKELIKELDVEEGLLRYFYAWTVVVNYLIR